MVGFLRHDSPGELSLPVFCAPSWWPSWTPTSRWTLATAYMKSCRTWVCTLKPGMALTTKAGAGQVGGPGIKGGYWEARELEWRLFYPSGVESHP